VFDIRSSPVAVFCRECVEGFPVTASKLFFRLFVTIPVASNITGIIIYFTFHIRYICLKKLLCFFPAFFYVTFLSAGIATSIRRHVSPFFFLIIIADLFTINSLLAYTLDTITRVIPSCSHSGLGVCVCVYIYIKLFLHFRCLALSIFFIWRNSPNQV